MAGPTRREFLELAGALGASLALGCRGARRSAGQFHAQTVTAMAVRILTQPPDREPARAYGQIAVICVIEFAAASPATVLGVESAHAPMPGARGAHGTPATVIESLPGVTPPNTR